MADGMAKKTVTAKAMPTWVMDNMDIGMQWFTEHLTQCVLVFKGVSTSGLNQV